MYSVKKILGQLVIQWYVYSVKKILGQLVIQWYVYSVKKILGQLGMSKLCIPRPDGSLTLLHSERPKLYTILAFLSAIGLARPRSAEGRAPDS